MPRDNIASRQLIDFTTIHCWLFFAVLRLLYLNLTMDWRLETIIFLLLLLIFAVMLTWTRSRCHWRLRCSRCYGRILRQIWIFTHVTKRAKIEDNKAKVKIG